MITTPTCPRCRTDMERGFMIERGESNRRSVTRWTEGVPQFSLWTGIKARGLRSFPIAVFRCQRCGLLESYAVED